MSIEKHLPSRPYLKRVIDSPQFQFRVRNISHQLKQPVIKRNFSHRILRKASSCLLLPKSTTSIPDETSLKSSFIKNNDSKVSLKKKVDFIKKRHKEEKSQASQTIIPQFQSENFIACNKKSKPKLKLLVRDPFHPSKGLQERKKTELFDQSKIENLENTSMISEANRQEFEQFLHCLN